MFAEDEAELLLGADGTAGELDAMVDRRVAGLPLEQVLGWAAFCGLRIVVAPGVFVPRRRTEFLAKQAIGLAAPDAVVLDMCCGAGPVGAAALAARPGVDLYAVDIDPVAVGCARRNVAAAGGQEDQVYAGDLYEPLPAELRGRIAVLVANAPYVPTEAIALMPPEAREYEPSVALDGGADGLDVQRRVIEAAPLWLTPWGHLLVETSERQAPGTLDAFVRSGLAGRVARSEEHDATVVVGSRAAGG